MAHRGAQKIIPLDSVSHLVYTESKTHALFQSASFRTRNRRYLWAGYLPNCPWPRHTPSEAFRLRAVPRVPIQLLVRFHVGHSTTGSGSKESLGPPVERLEYVGTNFLLFLSILVGEPSPQKLVKRALLGDLDHEADSWKLTRCGKTTFLLEHSNCAHEWKKRENLF